ncbi:MAG TPA: response regulator [Lapillicoccus sp.]|jgi:class 3 adenylate cyclase|nr:response regulator [Lapillicoccus sp.]
MTGAGGQPVVLVVDDLPANRRLMEAILAPHGYHVVEAESGEDALEILTEGQTDLVLLDLLMPGLDGHETCKRIRANPDTAYLPVVMVTASGPAEKVRAIDTGADDFISKPLDQAELLGRVRSLLRVKRYHDTVVTQAAELAQWNEELEGRVAAQVRQLERFGALRRFFSPQITRLLLEDGDDSFLTSHRREITAVFCDLRGFTAFAETSDPEEVMSVLAAYHQALGRLVFEHEGTLEHFAGDGLLVFFNDPVPIPDAPARAVRMAVRMREAVTALAEGWRRLGYDLALGVGISRGFATLGRIGFEGRYDYAAIGTVTNLSARLSAHAAGGQILVSQRVMVGAEDVALGREVGPLELRGFSKPLVAYEIVGLKEDEVPA